jgi:hypothetical protein
MEAINKKIAVLETREDFVDLVGELVKDLEGNPQDWENKSLKNYLEAIASWTEDMDGYYDYMKIPMPANVDWKVFANILIAAKMYE